MDDPKILNILLTMIYYQKNILKVQKNEKNFKLVYRGSDRRNRKSPKAPNSDTPNRNPKGKGTAKGDASTSRGAKVSKKDEATLKKKADDFNERYKSKLGYGVSWTIEISFSKRTRSVQYFSQPKDQICICLGICKS